MSRAIIVSFRKYQPYGDKYYQPLFDHFIHQLSTYVDEFDKLYILDSNWNFTDEDREKAKQAKGVIIPSDPSLRYYDAYKAVLPQVEEDLVMLTDNDFVIYRAGVIDRVFRNLDKSYDEYPIYDVVTIIDQIGTYTTDKLQLGNKFCPYLFATRKELLIKYLDTDWGSNMPHSETLGLLTEAMLNDGVTAYELEDDKSNILFDGTKDGDKSKDLGYYHIRAGSVPALLLAYREHDPEKYRHYLTTQPLSEILRQLAWYQYLGGQPEIIVEDIKLGLAPWAKYINDFNEYHGLI